MFISESEVGKAVSSKEHAVPTRKDSLFPSGAVPPAITTVSASFVHPGAALQAVAVSSKVAEKNGLNDKNVSEKKAVPNDYSPAMKRVLVVDDQEFNRAIIMQMISDRFNVELQGAGDGVEALAIMSASPTFDVILMDLQMPRMSGEACF